MDGPHSSYSCLVMHITGHNKIGLQSVEHDNLTWKFSLEALPVDNGWAALVVLLLGDPHLLEGGEGRQDGATDPDGVLPLRGSNDLDLDGGGSKSSDLLLHPVSNTRVHGGATRHDSVGVQVLPDVNIALHDGVVGGLVDTAGLHAEEGRLEEGLRGTEPLVADGDDLAVGKLIGLLKGSGGGSGGHLLLEVKGDVAELLPVGLGVEGSLSQEDGLLLRGNTELVVEGVMPDLLHVIPVGDDSVLHGVLQGEDTPLGLGLVSNIGV